MSNQKVPASKIPTQKKILLYPGDPLIGVLDPNSYVIVNKGSLDPVVSVSVNNDTSGGSGEDGGDGQDSSGDSNITNLKAPSLSDITLISKQMVTDGNKNQYVEFKFKVNNSVGTDVVGVNGYGQ